MTRIALISLALTAISGCAYTDDIETTNLRGKVVIPREAATRTMFAADGTTEEVTDSRLIGPVYLGLFPSIQEGLVEYPHPEIGPIFQTGVPGDAYPYGGTTIGDFRFACVEFLACKVSSGRFTDFDDLLGWFNTRLQIEVNDASGAPIETGEYIRQTCYEMLNYTTDDEIRLTARDENEDGIIDEKDLDFQENADGDFEADFTIWQQEFFKDEETGQGFSLWGWMDSPSEDSFRFSTCDQNQGQRETEYAADFRGGRQFTNLLNQPSQYIGGGDWTVSGDDGEGNVGWHVYESTDDVVVIRLDNMVEN